MTSQQQPFLKLEENINTKKIIGSCGMYLDDVEVR